MFERTKVLNSEILRITQKQLLQQLKRGVLITPNLDHLVKIQKDKDFYDLYHGKSLAQDGHDLPFPSEPNDDKPAVWVICDSVILWASCRLLGKNKLPEAIPGSSFFKAYYLHHRNDPNCKIFLLGAREGVADLARQRINTRVGREIVVGAHSPSFGFEKKPEEIDKIVDIVNQSGANVVLVGVGAQAAVIKAIKAGENVVDLSKPEGDGGDDNPGGGGQTPSSGSGASGDTGSGGDQPEI